MNVPDLHRAYIPGYLMTEAIAARRDLGARRWNLLRDIITVLAHHPHN
jgi:hypothetical protein